MPSVRGRRVAIVTRIYSPEPGAASFRLGSLARALRDAGAEVTVITTTPPRGYEVTEPEPGIDVRRVPALRDRDGYVRGYLHYLSFDVPAFFRVVFGRRFDAVVVEPPPTTGVVMRVACGARRFPYVYYAADIWSHAVAQTAAPRFVARAVRLLERFAVSGARAVVSVSEDVSRRVRDIAPSASVTTVGNGFDESLFTLDGERRAAQWPYLLYAGTASEVHGAGIFVEAMPIVRSRIPDARLVFVGQGADRGELESRAAEIAQGSVDFLPRLDPYETAAWIRGARATLASMRPDGYIAFPTKMHASVACGTRVVYAGPEPGRSFADSDAVGWSADYEPAAVAEAMIKALEEPWSEADRDALASWARETHSLRAVAARIVAVVGRIAEQARPAGGGRS